MAIKTGVIGAAGFAGIELVRLVQAHPDMDLIFASSSELAGQKISQSYAGFENATELVFSMHDDEALDDCDLVFLAVPHTAAMKYAPKLVNSGKIVVDLSADFRFKDAGIYEQWYGVQHSATDLLEESSFGLPELFPEGLKRLHQKHQDGEGVLVGCAGCYPTATSLAAAPFIRAGLLGEGIVVADAVSGLTGAGRKAKLRTHYCFADENVEAYAVGNHRHTPEIEQILRIEGRLVFTPHLVPMKRGILSTVTLPAKKHLEQEELDDIYRQFYRDSAFVSVPPSGAQPRTASVMGTNRAHVQVVVSKRMEAVIATAAIDNLCKGAAGQALQCANIVLGLPETTGLDFVAVPV